MNIKMRLCSIDDLEKLQNIGYETYNETFRTMNSQETNDLIMKKIIKNI